MNFIKYSYLYSVLLQIKCSASCLCMLFINHLIFRWKKDTEDLKIVEKKKKEAFKENFLNKGCSDYNLFFLF